MIYLENRGDRRGLNPRQLEPQSSSTERNALNLGGFVLAQESQRGAKGYRKTSVSVPGTETLGLLLGLALAGCAAPVDDTWHADDSFTQDERRAIAEGNLWLARQLDVEPKVIVWDLEPGAKHGAHTIRKGTVDTGANGQCENCSNETARLAFDPSQYGESAFWFLSLRHDAAHEFAHTYGMEHVQEETALMNASSSPWLTWTKDDTSECFRIGHCNKKEAAQ